MLTIGSSIANFLIKNKLKQKCSLKMTSSSENQNIKPFFFLEIGITLTFADILNLE